MASGIILDNHPLYASGVDGHGRYELFTSEKFNIPQSDTAIEVVIEYNDLLPGYEKAPLNYALSALLESEDEAGHWYVFHNQFDAVRGGDGVTQKLILNPNIFVLDQGISNDVSDGFNIILRESQKQGIAPDDFRLKIILNEYGYDTPGAFESVVITASYKTFSL